MVVPCSRRVQVPVFASGLVWRNRDHEEQGGEAADADLTQAAVLKKESVLPTLDKLYDSSDVVEMDPRTDLFILRGGCCGTLEGLSEGSLSP